MNFLHTSAFSDLSVKLHSSSLSVPRLPSTSHLQKKNSAPAPCSHTQTHSRPGCLDSLEDEQAQEHKMPPPGTQSSSSSSSATTRMHPVKLKVTPVTKNVYRCFSRLQAQAAIRADAACNEVRHPSVSSSSSGSAEQPSESAAAAVAEQSSSALVTSATASASSGLTVETAAALKKRQRALASSSSSSKKHRRKG